jgi:hypothetical protein
MTDTAPAPGSRFWRVAFRVMYRLVRLMDPLVRSYLALGLPGLDGVVRISVVGRRSGRRRRTLVTLLRVGPGWYVGHPNGETGWTRNAEAAGVIEIDPAPGVAGGREFGVTRLEPGAERTAVVEATRREQPFPANLIYGAAARHIAAVGVYFRVERDA